MRAKGIMRMGLVGLLIGSMFAVAPAAMAKDGVDARGTCSGAATWKLGLRTEDGGMLEAEFQVQNAKPGQTWAVRLADNGTRFFSGTKTVNSLGKFTVRKLTTNQAGSDKITARATNNVTGQVCSGSATL
jgi:hypothetical protein